jgi:hypothetical protein
MRNYSKLYFVVYFKPVELFWYIFIENLFVFSYICFNLLSADKPLPPFQQAT